MTVKELYEKCKQFMFEKQSSKIYDNYVIEICNQKLSELYQDNNMCRMFYGLEPLTIIPQVTAMSDELGVIEDATSLGDGLGIMPEYQLEVLPIGMVAEFLMDDDLNKMSRFDTKYNNARVMHQKLVSQDVLDRIDISSSTSKATKNITETLEKVIVVEE